MTEYDKIKEIANTANYEEKLKTLITEFINEVLDLAELTNSPCVAVYSILLSVQGSIFSNLLYNLSPDKDTEEFIAEFIRYTVINLSSVVDKISRKGK